MPNKFTLIAYLCLFSTLLNAQNVSIIKGKVIEQVTLDPMIGATVFLNNSNDTIGVVTDINGEFTINQVPYGIYSITVTHIGYETTFVSDIAVYDNKGSYIEVLLPETTEELEEVLISAYQNPAQTIDPLAQVSVRSISIEETRRFAGSLGDPSRMALSYAGVNSGRGDQNNIIIRGNSAKYLQWQLEGLEIPNPNHFGTYGSSGGLLSILNSNNLGRSNFYIGAFPAHTGNALAGVFDLSLKNGDPSIHKHSIETGLIGLSLSSEGPLSKTGKSSYIFNYRYSTLGLMKNLGLVFQAPVFQDLSFKVHLPTKKAGTISIYGLAGLGKNLETEFFRQIDSSQFRLNMIGDTIWGFREIGAENLNRYNLALIGIKQVLPLGKKFILSNHFNFSNVFSAPRSSGFNRDNFTTFLNEEGRFSNSIARFQSELKIYLHEKHFLHLGGTFSYRTFNSKLIEGFPDFTQNTILENEANSLLSQAFISYKNQSIPELEFITGLHYTHFNLNNQHIVEPRLSVSLSLSDKSSLSFATGVHSMTESPEVYLIFNDSPNIGTQSLKLSRSWQSVLSYKRQLGKKLFLTAELYYQYLFDIPIAADSSNFSLINEDVSFTNIQLINQGKGINYGLELTLEKFFSRSYYFLLTASLFQSEYQLMESFYRKSRYSNSYVINLLSGKEFKLKRNKFFGLNIRSTFSGGAPYIPVLLEESIAANSTIRDERRAYFQQLPPYISIDLSMSYKWIRTKLSHEIKLDIFRLFEQNYFDEVFEPESLSRDGTINPASVKQLKYGEGQTSSTVLPLLYYKMTF